VTALQQSRPVLYELSTIRIIARVAVHEAPTLYHGTSSISSWTAARGRDAQTRGIIAWHQNASSELVSPVSPSRGWRRWPQQDTCMCRSQMIGSRGEDSKQNSGYTWTLKRQISIAGRETGKRLTSREEVNVAIPNEARVSFGITLPYSILHGV
jgi:hypothetical protein